MVATLWHKHNNWREKKFTEEQYTEIVESDTLKKELTNYNNNLTVTQNLVKHQKDKLLKNMNEIGQHTVEIYDINMDLKKIALNN